MIPQIFNKTGGDTVATMNMLTTPMVSSSVFKKLETDSERSAAVQAAAGQNAGKAGKAGKANGKGAKGGGSGKGKSKKGGKSEPTNGGENEKVGKQWCSMVFPLDGPAPDGSGGRQKNALDDFMSVVLEIIESYQAKLGDEAKVVSDFEKHVGIMFHHAASCFMEFVWSGSVAMNGKFVRIYSAFRDELSTFATTACELAASASKPPASSSAGAASSGLSLGLSFATFMDGGSGSDISMGNMTIGHIKDTHGNFNGGRGRRLEWLPKSGGWLL